jgi:methylmalonyl-CoA mutase N-terminal domain/subunit
VQVLEETPARLAKFGLPPVFLPHRELSWVELEAGAELHVRLLHARNATEAPQRLKQLQHVAVHNGNLFAELMETVKFCSLGQITNALFEVGGQYRRNM